MNNDRRAVLVSLLDHWRDFFDEPTPNGRGSTDDETRRSAEDWSLFSTMGRQQPALELRRCVLDCRKRYKQHYAALMAYHAYCEWRQVRTKVRVRNAHGKWVEKDGWARERVVPDSVDERMVDVALSFLLFVWDSNVKLELPAAMSRRLAEVTTEQGTYLTTEAA